jgi:succinyl-CoA synthetase beta subunit
MNIHEHQAKAVLSEFGVAVPRGYPAFTVDEAVKAAEQLGGPVFVVKSQIHAGGRGKGRFEGLGPDAKGGVRVVKSVGDVKTNAAEMLGRVLVTHQTGPKGKQVNRLYIEEGAAIAKEFYLSLLVDRETSRVSVVASTEGGMDIEEVAHSTPRRSSPSPSTRHRRLGSPRPLARRGAGPEGRPRQAGRQAAGPALCRLRRQGHGDAGGEPADRHRRRPASRPRRQGVVRRQRPLPPPELAALRDETEEDPKEIEAAKYDLSYIALDGEIGCMVNGAGLAMATMDIIKLYGAEPANFLDVGGGADEAKVTAAFKIIIADPNVKGILVNIFGGIARCDILAMGVVAAVKQVGLQVPLVVRLEGTNAELGKKIINESGLNVIAANDLSDGAEKIVKAVRGAQ